MKNVDQLNLTTRSLVILDSTVDIGKEGILRFVLIAENSLMLTSEVTVMIKEFCYSAVKIQPETNAFEQDFIYNNIRLNMFSSLLLASYEKT